MLFLVESCLGEVCIEELFVSVVNLGVMMGDFCCEFEVIEELLIVEMELGVEGWVVRVLRI